MGRTGALPTDLCSTGLGSGDLKMSPLQVCLSVVELGSRWRHQVRLLDHGEETEGETHPQDRTEEPQAGSDVAEEMEQWREDRQMLQGWCSHGDVGSPKQA